jgi:hypothetical protein
MSGTLKTKPRKRQLKFNKVAALPNFFMEMDLGQSKQVKVK